MLALLDDASAFSNAIPPSRWHGPATGIAVRPGPQPHPPWRSALLRRRTVRSPRCLTSCLPEPAAFVLDSASWPTEPIVRPCRLRHPCPTRPAMSASSAPSRRCRRPSSGRRPGGIAGPNVCGYRHPGHRGQRRSVPADRAGHHRTGRRGCHGGGEHRRSPGGADRSPYRPIPLSPNTFRTTCCFRRSRCDGDHAATARCAARAGGGRAAGVAGNTGRTSLR